MIDCSNCKYCYVHGIMWGEFWCKKKNDMVYDCHSLKRRFREDCEHYEKK